MDWRPLSSSNLNAFRYDPTTQTLSIRFNSGRAYDYAEVPQSIVDGLESADSPGRYFNSAIKGSFTES